MFKDENSSSKTERKIAVEILENCNFEKPLEKTLVLESHWLSCSSSKNELYQCHFLEYGKSLEHWFGK